MWTLTHTSPFQVKGKPRRSTDPREAPGAGGGVGGGSGNGGGGGGGGGGGSNRRVGRRTTIGAKSLGAQFRENLNNLVATVDKTHPHYVRTIKPNDDLKPGTFTYDRIAEQLRNAGVLEVVRVARAGFPVRLGIQEFIDRYAVLAPLVVETAYRNCAQVSRRRRGRGRWWWWEGPARGRLAEYGFGCTGSAVYRFGCVPVRLYTAVRLYRSVGSIVP